MVKLQPKSLKLYSIRRDNLDMEGQMDKLSELSSRLPPKGMPLADVVRD